MQHQDPVKQTRSEVSDFLTTRIPITVLPSEQTGGREFTYDFSQREVLAIIDLYWNSQFKSGPYDKEGLQKIFLNVGKFRTEVAVMQIDIDIANYRFLPVGTDLWGPWLMSRDYHQWAVDHDFGQTINNLGDDLPRYGTCVTKRVGDDLLRVPIARLMNTQNAPSLKAAALSGGFVIEALDMTPYEMEQYPDWNLDKVDKEVMKKGAVYERYGLITPAHLKIAEGTTPNDDDWKEWFLGLSVVATDVSKKEQNGGLVFAERIDEKDFPYEECHWSRQDGRWLGIGEMENQFMNQLARNISTHMRQKGMYWAAKKIFTKTTADGPNNLAKDVSDGAVLDLGPAGSMNVVNTQTQHLSDFNAWDQTIEQNADNTSFTYEAATGESPKAGTAFSLQVQLDRTLQKHYGKKRENFGLFLKRAFFNQTVPIFKKQTRKQHTLTFAYTDDDADFLREAIIKSKVEERKRQLLYSGRVRRKSDIETEIRQEMEREPYLIVDIPKGHYDNVKYHTKLEITGEETNVAEDMQTLITLWQALIQQQDPRAEKVLARILSFSNSNLRLMVGNRPTPQHQPAQAAPEAPIALNTIQNETATA